MKELLGFWRFPFNDDPPRTEALTVGFDLDSKHALDIAAAFATSGASVPFSLAWDYFNKPIAPEQYTFSASDPTKSALYKKAQENLARAQAAQQAAAGRTSTYAPSAVIPVNVPSFSLPPSPFSIPNTAPLFPTPVANAPEVPTTDSVQGEAPMSNAAAHVEAVTKQHGLHASIAPDGNTSCPSCGTPLCLHIAGGPTCEPGQPAGTVQVVGEYEEIVGAIHKAHSPGTCVCTCPKCGVPICLELTDHGYDPNGTRAETVSGYHLLGLQPGVRPVLGGYLPNPGMRPIYGASASGGYLPNPGMRPVYGALTKNKPSPHRVVIKNAGNAVAKAKKAGALASARAKQYDPSKHKTIVPLTAVHGYIGGDVNQAIDVFGNRVHPIEATIDVFGNLNVGEECVYVHGDTVLGADRPLTPKQKKAVQHHANTLVRHAKAAKKAADAGAKATKAAADLDTWRKAKAPLIAKFINRQSPSTGQLKSGPAGHVQVLGCSPVTIFGLDASGLAPGEPGYDPSTEDGTGAGGGGNGSYPAPTPLYDASSNPDPNCVPLPVRGGSLSSEDARTVWRKVPEDGVIYAGDRGMPSDCFGSWNIMYGPKWINDQQGDGFVWHANPGEPAKWWAIRRGHGDAQHAGDDIAGSSSQFGWGPLVGNPSTELAGLQWAIDDKQWFWQSQNAPAWATQEADAVILATNQKTMEADNAAIAADNARIAQEVAADAEAKAKQDAADALAISAANTQEQIAQKQQAAQQAQIDLQQQQYEQQAAAQQAANDLAAQQAEIALQTKQAQLQQQAQQADIQAAMQQQAIQLQYLQQHPELTMQPDQGGSSSSSEGGGFADDGGSGGDPFAVDGQSFNDPSSAFTDDAAMDLTDGM